MGTDGRHLAVNAGFAKRPTKGMIVRSEEILEPGVTLFKLGHRFVRGKRLSDIEIVSSPWWLSEASVEMVMQSAAGGDARLSEAFRRFGAIAKRFKGSGDNIVKVTTAASLLSYIGPGTIQDFRNINDEVKNNEWDMPLWCPPSNIPQIYIPVVHRRQTYGDINVTRAAYKEIYIVPIDKWRDEFLRKDPEGKWRIV